MPNNNTRRLLEDMPMHHYLVNNIPKSNGTTNVQLEELLRYFRQNKSAHPTGRGRAAASRRETLLKRASQIDIPEESAYGPAESKNILTSGPILLPQSGFIRIEALNGSSRESKVYIRVYNLDLSPKVLLRIGGIGFCQRFVIPGNSIATIGFEASLRKRSHIEVEICADEQTYPALYLSTEPGDSIKTLLTSADFIKTGHHAAQR